MRLTDQMMSTAGGAEATTAGTPWGFGLGAITGIGNMINQGNTNKQNQMNSLETQNFQRESRDNAHQIEVKDMMAAGLNPNLSATGGAGAATPPGSTPNMVAPQVTMPDMLQYGISLKQLEQTDERIAIDKANSTASIAHNLSSADWNKIKSQLGQKGMIRADLEGEGSQLLRNVIKYLKKGYNNKPAPLEETEDPHADFLNNNRFNF